MPPGSLSSCFGGCYASAQPAGKQRGARARPTILDRSMSAVTKSFRHEGHRLVYDEYGEGDKVVVLLPGLLFSRRMHEPLAEALAERGNRVLCLDLLGHGDSDRPPEMPNYSMTIFGRQVIGLLDHAGVDQAVLGGPSLGANTALEAAAAAPERVKGLLVEMPVLDNALLGARDRLYAAARGTHVRGAGGAARGAWRPPACRAGPICWRTCCSTG